MAGQTAPADLGARIAELSTLDIAENASPETFAAQTKAFSHLAQPLASQVRALQGAVDLSSLLLFVGTTLPELCRRAALQPAANDVSLFVKASLDLCGSLLVQTQGMEGVLALTRILLGEGPPLDAFYQHFGQPLADVLAGQPFLRWPGDEDAVVARGRALVGRALRNKKGTVADFDPAARTFTLQLQEERTAGQELTEDALEPMISFYSETSLASSTIKLLVPPNPKSSLNRWVVARILRSDTVVTEDGELLCFSVGGLAKERFKHLTPLQPDLPDPMASAVAAAPPGGDTLAFALLPSARLAPSGDSWFSYAHIEALGLSGGLKGIVGCAQTIPDLVHVACALDRLVGRIKPAVAQDLVAELVQRLQQRQYDLRGGSVLEADLALQRLSPPVEALSQGGAEDLMRLRLDTLLNFTASTVLSQRLQAVSQIVAVAEKAQPALVLAWVDKSKALERILTQNTHVEVVRRAAPLVALVGKAGGLTTAHLSLLWELSRLGDFELTQAAQQMLLVAAPLLDASSWLSSACVAALPPAEVDEERLRFARDVALCSPHFPADAGPAIDVLLSLMRSLSSPGLCRFACDMTVEVAALCPVKKRAEVVDACLQAGVTAPHLILVQGLVRTLPTSADDRKFFSFSRQPRTQQAMILHMDHKHRILQHLVMQWPGPASSTACFSPEEQTEVRLDFIGFALAHSTLKLSEKLVEHLWHATVVNAASPSLANLALRWFGRAHGPISQSPMATPLSPLFESGLEPVNPKKAALSKPALSNEAELWVLTKGLPELRPESASLTLVDVTVDYVLSVSRKSKAVKAPSPTEQDQLWLRRQRAEHRGGNLDDPLVPPETRRARAVDVLERVAADVAGLDLLWRLAMEAKREDAAAWALSVCVQLHLAVGSPKLESLRSAFCLRCLDKDPGERKARALLLFLRRACKINDAKLELVVLPPLHGTPGSLSRRDVPVLTRTGPACLTVDPDACSVAELKKRVASALDYNGRVALSLRVVQLRGDEMGRVLSDDDSLASLGSRATLQAMLVAYEDETEDEDDSSSSGSDVDESELCTLEMECGESFDSKPESWPPPGGAPAEEARVAAAAALPPGLFEPVAKRVEACADAATRAVLWDCLLLLPCDSVVDALKASAEFKWDALLPASVALAQGLQGVLALGKSDAAWLASACQAGLPARLQALLEPSLPDVLVPLLLRCLELCWQHAAKDRVELAAALLDTARRRPVGHRQALDLVARWEWAEPEPRLVAALEQLLLALPLSDEGCAGVFLLLQARPALLSEPLQAFLFASLLPRLLERPDSATALVMLARLCGLCAPQEEAFAACRQRLFALRQAAAAAEPSHVLGLLRVMRALVRPGVQAADCVQQLASWLFALPLFLVHDDHREAAFFLLAELCRAHESNLAALLSELDAVAPNGRLSGWGFDPAQVRHPMQYSGMENLGTTCYLNSLVQQLFHARAFAQQVKGEAELVRALQQVFAQMLSRKLVHTRPFCSLLREYDGSPMDVMEQKDVQEFSDMLFTRLENEGLKVLLQKQFGGQIVQQTSSEDPSKPYSSEQVEPFYLVPVEVKGKASLLQGLDALVRPERLVGNSRLELPNGGDKVNGVLRRVLRTLPPTMLIHLKRFDFSMTTMTKLKINDYCSFPQQLDMAPYSDRSQPAEYYQYELCGILVHAGGADSGHYYSFIRERTPLWPEAGRLWYEFNDNVAWPYACDRIPVDCFGGTYTVARPNGQGNVQVHRPQSAYILVYDRVSSLADQPPAAALPSPPANEATEVLFAPSCALFVLSLVRQALASTDAQAALGGFKLGVRFLVEVLARAAPPSRRLVIREWASVLVVGAAALLPTANWLVETLAVQADSEGSWLVAVFFQCPDRVLRTHMAELIVVALNRLVSDYPASKDLARQGDFGPGDVAPPLYKIQGSGPVSRVAWLLDALCTCMSVPSPTDEFFDLVLTVMRSDKALCAYMVGRGATVSLAELYVRGADDNALQKHPSSRHHAVGYLKKPLKAPSYPSLAKRPLASLLVMLVEDKPDALSATLIDAVIDAASKRRHDDVAAKLVHLLWKPNTVIDKLLTWARRRPLDINVLYEYSLLAGRQAEVASALVNAVDDMLLDGATAEFYNVFVLQATRALSKLEGEKKSKDDEFKRTRKRMALWPKNLTKKLAAEEGQGS